MKVAQRNHTQGGSIAAARCKQRPNTRSLRASRASAPILTPLAAIRKNSRHDPCYFSAKEIAAMPKPFTEWTVLPHGALEQLDDRLMTVSGNIHMPLVDFPRRMTVARLDDGRLVIFSAIALDEQEMARLEAFGTPAFLVVPNER
ncbi:MAG TPA: hypothetical protein VGM44_02745, partial [Polyangiaceae bacterium]